VIDAHSARFDQIAPLNSEISARFDRTVRYSATSGPASIA
jgi:hypothetical protein